MATRTLAQLPPPAIKPRQLVAIIEPREGVVLNVGAEVRGTVAVVPSSRMLVYRVFDATGQVVGRGPLAATGAPGQPGAFAGHVSFAAPEGEVKTGAALGRLEVLDLSSDESAIAGGAWVNIGFSQRLAPATGRRANITVQAPRPGSLFASGSEVHGTINQAPAGQSLAYRVYDGGGNLAGRGTFPVEAPPGGTTAFVAPVTFSVRESGAGRLEVLDLDPVDARVLSCVAVNVTLATGPLSRATTPTLWPTAALKAAAAVVEPVIALSQPRSGDGLASPARVQGTISVAPFDNALIYRVSDVGGRTLGQGPIVVQSSTLGGAGTFDRLVTFNAAHAGPGRIEIIDPNLQAGQPPYAAVTVTVSLSPTRGSLVGPEWELVSVDGQPVVSGGRVTASFSAAGRLSGSAGCNSYSAGYVLKDQVVEIGRPGATRKRCTVPRGLMEQEAAYLAALEAARLVRLQPGQMQLLDDTGQHALLFRPTSPDGHTR